METVIKQKRYSDVYNDFKKLNKTSKLKLAKKINADLFELQFQLISEKLPNISTNMDLIVNEIAIVRYAK